MRVSRSTAPTRVIRLSLACAQRQPHPFSASVRILRNLMTSNSRSLKPTRVCRYRIGPRNPDSIQIANAAPSMSGQVSASRQQAGSDIEQPLDSLLEQSPLKPFGENQVTRT
jgi:hypothetical protein